MQSIAHMYDLFGVCTVAIFAQGTSRAVAATQALLFLNTNIFNFILLFIIIIICYIVYTSIFVVNLHMHMHVDVCVKHKCPDVGPSPRAFFNSFRG